MPAIRLLATPIADHATFGFHLAFSAPHDEEAATCSPLALDFGDGSRTDLGLICAPTAFTWAAEHQIALTEHTYTTPGPHSAGVQWGEATATTGTDAHELRLSDHPQPDLPVFAASVTEPLVAVVQVKVVNLGANQRLRLDGGAGQIFELAGANGPEQEATWTLGYPKPSHYTLRLALLDSEGFWLADLAQTTVEIAEPIAGPTTLSQALAAADVPSLPEVAAAAADPWLPYRYAYPLWAWARTYTTPGGTAVSRSLAPGTYLGIDAETWAGGGLWYRTLGRDWIPASSVGLFRPSTLRGTELGAPPPPPPPPPGRRGIVTADRLNVRARPGAAANNPPIDSLPRNTEVAIYEEARASDGLWYRIGVNRWVHSKWVRLLAGAAETASAAASATAANTAAVSLPVGWVFASSLAVRARPGAAADNPPIDHLAHNQMVSVLETRAVGSETWHRIGADRWLSGQWLRLARPRPRPAAIGATERWVGVSLSTQTAIAYDGDRPVYAAMIASGLPGTPTVQGIFRTWARLPSTKMSGGRPGQGYYYLEGVTWTCYFYRGYALHTAYWHDAFGAQRSHGCVNLSPYDAWWIFQWSAAGGGHSPAVYTYW
jgi:hypothetical protein